MTSELCSNKEKDQQGPFLEVRGEDQLIIEKMAAYLKTKDVDVSKVMLFIAGDGEIFGVTADRNYLDTIWDHSGVYRLDESGEVKKVFK